MKRNLRRWDLLVIFLLQFVLTHTSRAELSESCSGKLKSATLSSNLVTPLNQNGGWMKDPLQVSDRLYYMGYDEFLTRHLFEYETSEGLRGGETAKAFYSLPRAAAGTGFVVYDRSIFYIPEETRKVVRFDLTTQSVEAEVEISEANYDGTSPYGIGLATDIDLAVDEHGLWAIYATEYNDGNIVISRLDHQTLAIQQTWTTDYYKLSALNAFMICGVLYTVNYNTLRIDFMFNTASNVGTKIDVYVPQLTNKASSINYNSKEKKLYVWDKGNAISYQLAFEKIVPSVKPTPPPATTLSSTSTTTTRSSNVLPGKTDPPPPFNILTSSTRSPWSRTTSTRSSSDGTTAAPVSNSRHLVMLRLGLTVSICLLVAAGIVIFFCVLPSEKREYFRHCCFGYSRKSTSGRYGNNIQYTGSISNTLYGGHLSDTAFTRATFIGDDPSYCRSCSTVTGCATTLLPVAEAQGALLHKPPPQLERTARSLSDMDVGRIHTVGGRYSHNTVAHGGYTTHIPTSTCACYNHLHEECPCGSFCHLTPRNCTVPAAVVAVPESYQYRQSPHHYETVDKNFLHETSEDVVSRLLNRAGEPIEQYQNNDGRQGVRSSSPRIEDSGVEIANLNCTVENPGYAAHIGPNCDRPRSVESLPAPRPRIKMGTSGLTLLNPRSDSDVSPARPDSGYLHGNQDKRSSDPLSMDLGYVTDNQNLDCSQCGQVHGENCPHCRSPSSDLQKPTLVVRSIGNACSRDTLNSIAGQNRTATDFRGNKGGKRRSLHNTSDYSDCPSENDREVERIITCRGEQPNSVGKIAANPDHYYSDQGDFARTHVDPAYGEMIETDMGGRISAAETVTSWSAYAGSEASGTNSHYGSNGPCNKRLSDLHPAHSSNNSHGQIASPHNKKYTYTLPGTAAAVTKAKIDLKAGGISMITNL